MQWTTNDFSPAAHQSSHVRSHGAKDKGGEEHEDAHKDGESD